MRCRDDNLALGCCARAHRLLLMPRLDPFDLNAGTQPPHRELAEAILCGPTTDARRVRQPMRGADYQRPVSVKGPASRRVPSAGWRDPTPLPCPGEALTSALEPGDLSLDRALISSRS